MHFRLAQAGVKEKRFANLFLDGVHGIQRGHGFLKNHGDVPAPQLAQLGLGETGDFHLASVPLLETDGTALTQRKGKGEEAHDGGTSDALAAAGFSHDAEVLLFADREVHTLHQLDRRFPPALGELDGEVAYFQQMIHIPDLPFKASTWGPAHRGGCRPGY